MTQQVVASQTKDPGRTLGIVGLVLSVFLSLVGLIVSIVGLRKSRSAGFTNIPAILGIVVGALFTLGSIVGFVLVGVPAIQEVGRITQKCAELGPGVHEVGEYTYRCR